MATAQPVWRAPPAPSPAVAEKLPPLCVYNSLTRTKTSFVPLDPDGRKVGWYACGPTVYDDAHLGHARNFVSTDVIRRIIQDYFKFKVNFVLNITDVDDKIILAARQQHLLSEYLGQHNELDENVRDTAREAFMAYVAQNLPLLSHNMAPETYFKDAASTYNHVLRGQSLEQDGNPAGDREAKVKMHLTAADAAAWALITEDIDHETWTAKTSGVMLPYLDSLHGREIQGKDHAIFTKLTKKYEERFFDDMAALNVRPPDKLTRVTEYGPQIVDYVKQLQDNGFSYEYEGSIYFDTSAWEKSGGVYARLEPWNKGDTTLQADGEGALSAKKTGFKRSPADFALWKASKPGEPSWPSPWGEGRPGWHIECSVMASDVLGKQFDIHSGGIDLAFPHHDNELAQSEAYWCDHKSGRESTQWVNYFLHMGHLSIQGSKMSKSLKNYTTIREALAKGAWTPRSLRIVFLLGAWKDGLEITDEVVKAGTAWEDRVNNFFLKVADLERNPTPTFVESTNGHNGRNGKSKTNGITTPPNLMESLETAKHDFKMALCDSFDTPSAMRVISDLITKYNSTKPILDTTSFTIGCWITELVTMFGLDTSPRPDRIGWSGNDIPEKSKPFVYPLSKLRNTIRQQAIAGEVTSIPHQGYAIADRETTFSADQPYANAYADFQRELHALLDKKAPSKDYLTACDRLRDETLWNLSIYLEDREGRPALVRPLDAALREERANHETLAAEKEAKRKDAKAKSELEERERLEKGKLDPLQMFRTSEYAEWNAEGLPTKDVEGKEVAKSRGKKLKKDWERQKKLHEAWKANAAGADGTPTAA